MGYVYIPQAVMRRWETITDIPKEDIGIYFTAILGGGECFVSSNRELVRDVVAKQRQFACLTCEEFVDEYIEEVINDKSNVDRRIQVHGLPGLPGILQGVERPAG